MKTAQLKIVKVAETKFVLTDSEGAPWSAWITDSEHDASTLVEFAGRACYDPETEIMTENGWKRFPDLLPGERVATLNPRLHIVEYQAPSAHIAYRYHGPMYQVKTKFLDLFVTPDHRMYQSNSSKHHFRFRTAAETLGRNVRYIQAADGWLGEDVEEFELPEVSWSQHVRNHAMAVSRRVGGVRITSKPRLLLRMDLLLEFLGYFIAEGCSYYDGYGHHKIQITQHASRMDKVVRVVKALGFSPLITSDPRRPHIQSLIIYSIQLAQFLRPLGQAAEKYIPREFMQLGRRQLRILLNALVAGDGAAKDGAYWTASRQLADDVSELAYKLGYTPTIQKYSEHDLDRTTMYRVGISNRRETTVLRRFKADQWVPFDGIVYCVTVPNGIVYVRRNGKPVFCGNCYQSWHKPNPATSSNDGYVTNILNMQHYSVLEHAGFAVMLTGLSRSVSHELVRHRHLSFSQLSQRFVNEDEAPFVIPPLFREYPEATAVFEELYARTRDAYRRLVEIGTRKLVAMDDKTLRRKRVREAARAVLPNMTETHMVMSGNHRAWREFFEKRGELHVDAEMREVALTIFKQVAQPLAPAIYKDFRVSFHQLPTGEAVQVLERNPEFLAETPATPQR